MKLSRQAVLMLTAAACELTASLTAAFTGAAAALGGPWPWAFGGLAAFFLSGA